MTTRRVDVSRQASEIPGAEDLVEASRAVAQGRYAHALSAAERAVEVGLSSPVAQRHVVVRAHELISRVHLGNGDLVRAADAVVRASAAAAAANPNRRRDLLVISGIATALVLSELGDHANALFELDQALPRIEKGYAPSEMAQALLAYGKVMQSAERPGQSRVWLHSAHRIAELNSLAETRSETIVAEVASWYGGGQLAANHGEITAARNWWQTGLSEAEAAFDALSLLPGEHRRNVAQVARTRSLCLAALGRDQEAYTGLLRAQSLAADVLPRTEIVRISAEMARILQRQGQPDQARTLLTLAIAEAELLPGSAALLELLELGSRLAQQWGDLDQALAFHRRFHDLHATWMSKLSVARERILLERIGSRKGISQGSVESRRKIKSPQSNQPPGLTAVESLGVFRDAVTGLLLRQVLLGHLADRLELPLARRQPLSVAMIDIDNFVKITERFSAEVSVQVLRSVAAIVVDACRSADLIVRAEGSQFVAVFHEVELRTALGICERIRTAVSEFGWTGLSPDLTVSVSIGVADVRSALDASAALDQVAGHVDLARRSGSDRVAAQPLGAWPPLPRASSPHEEG